jgi:two-component system OmpR family response regulator
VEIWRLPTAVETSVRILLVEDDVETCEHIIHGLRLEGHEAVVCHDGLEGLRRAQSDRFDALILDRMLPGMDGVELLRCVRTDGNKVPTIFVTTMNGLNDRVEGLRAGADDYLVKPFVIAELLARLEAMTRRSQFAGAIEASRLTVGDFDMDLVRRTVKRAGVAIDLTPQEFRLLEYMMRNVGRVCSRKMLLENVWDIHFDPGTNIVHVHMSRLRGKVGANGFRTVQGVGYVFSLE